MTTLIDRKAADPHAQAASQIHDKRQDRLLEILHDVQHAAGFISDGAISTIAEQLNLSRAEVLGVVSFYDDFLRTPAQGIDVRICLAEACRAVGAKKLYDWASNNFKVGGVYNIHHVYCLGNCALGPSAMISGHLHGRLTTTSLEAACATARNSPGDE